MKKKLKSVWTPIVVQEPGDSKDKKLRTVVVAKYNEDLKQLRIEVTREQFRKGAWEIDADLLKLALERRATILLKDKTFGWEFSVAAVDFAYHSMDNTLKAEHWKIDRAKRLSYVTECHSVACIHNYARQCLSGTIKLNKEGMCTAYE